MRCLSMERKKTYRGGEKEKGGSQRFFSFNNNAFKYRLIWDPKNAGIFGKPFSAETNFHPSIVALHIIELID